MVGSNPMIHKVRIGKVQRELTVNIMKCELSSSCTNTCREKIYSNKRDIRFLKHKGPSRNDKLNEDAHVKSKLALSFFCLRMSTPTNGILASYFSLWRATSVIGTLLEHSFSFVSIPKTILFICFNSKWFNFIPNNYILLRFNCLCLVWDFLWDCSWCFWFGYWKCSGLFYRFILILFLCLCVCFLCSIVFYVYSKLLKGLIVFYFFFALLFFLYFDCFSLFFCLNVYTVNIYIYRQYMFVFMFQIRFCWFVQSVF